LAARAARPGDRKILSFAGRRQGHRSFLWSVKVEFAADTPGGAAGLMLFQNDDFHIRFELGGQTSRRSVRVVIREAGKEVVGGSAPVPEGPGTLEVRARLQELDFAWIDARGRHTVAQGIDGRLLSTERAGGFVGTILALFATGGGQDSLATADFTEWNYQGL
jgi:alpha-N-arabinofuranosidase